MYKVGDIVKIIDLWTDTDYYCIGNIISIWKENEDDIYNSVKVSVINDSYQTSLDKIIKVNGIKVPFHYIVYEKNIELITINGYCTDCRY